MTEVHIERAALSEGSVLVFKDYGDQVRMAYDPQRIDETHALDVLGLYVPRVKGVPHRALHRV